MDSTVLQALTGLENSTAKLTNEDNLRSERPSTFTATIKDIVSVNAIYPGRIVYIGYYEGMGTVTMLVSNSEIVRYMNLTTVNAMPGSTVKSGSFLGLASKKYGLQFEYCSEAQGESNMPVRVNFGDKVLTYFKQNPIELLDGIYVPNYYAKAESLYVPADQTVEFTEEQKYEFNNYIVQQPEIVDNTNEWFLDPANMQPDMVEELSDKKGVEL